MSAWGQPASPFGAQPTAFGQQPTQFGSPFGGGAAAAPTVVADAKVPGPAGAAGCFSDGITGVSMTANLLLGSSWDGHLRVWQVAKQGQAAAAQCASQVAIDGNSPVLGSCFNGDGSAAVAGCADNTVRMWAFQGAATATTIGRHDAPVKSVKWLANNMVASGSWDNTVRFWDTRSPTEAFKLQHNAKVLFKCFNF